MRKRHRLKTSVWAVHVEKLAESMADPVGAPEECADELMAMMHRLMDVVEG